MTSCTSAVSKLLLERNQPDLSLVDAVSFAAIPLPSVDQLFVFDRRLAAEGFALLA